MKKTKTFDRKFMKQLAELCAGDTITKIGEWSESYGDFGEDTQYEVILNEYHDSGRWKSQHNLIFLDTVMDIYYYVRYERGLTESQMYDPFDGETIIECEEVVVTKTERIVYDYTWESAK